MPVYTDVASAEVKRHVRTLYGMMLTRPMLLVSDGIGAEYACDVQVAQTDPSGAIRQYMTEKEQEEDRNEDQEQMLTGLKGQSPEDWQIEDSDPGGVDTTLHNVPLARNNKDLIYGDIGSPVKLERSEDGGQWTITGFSMERPGTHFLYPVDLGNMVTGEAINLSTETRLLTLAELGILQPFGDLAFGASAIYQGGKLLRVA